MGFKGWKLLICIILINSFIGVFFLCPVNAASIKVDLDYLTLTVGQRITVPVTVHDDPNKLINLRYFQVMINFDPLVLSCDLTDPDSVSLPQDLLPPNAYIQCTLIEPGKLLVGIVASDAIINERVLFNIKFNAIGGGITKITPLIDDSLIEIGNDLDMGFGFIASGSILVPRIDGVEGDGGLCFINSCVAGF